jgi:hypothetical protein
MVVRKNFETIYSLKDPLLEQEELQSNKSSVQQDSWTNQTENASLVK